MRQPRNEGISIGTRFYLNNTKFEIAFFNASRVRYAACDGGKPRTLPLTTFWELKEAGNIQLLSLDGSGLATDDDASLARLSPARKEEVDRRRLYVMAALKGSTKPFSRRNLNSAIADVHKLEVKSAESTGDAPPKAPSPSTLARWTHRFIESAYDLASLASNTYRRGPQSKRLPIEAESVIAEVIGKDYLTEQRISATQAYCNVVGEIESTPTFAGVAHVVPSERTVQRRVAEVDPYVRTLRRYGRKHADRLARPAGTSTVTSRPMEWVFMDGHKLDVIVVDPDTGESLGRPFLVALIDHQTRALVGWNISLIPFCSTTALAAIKDMSGRDPSKGPGGVPEKLTPDLGPDLIAAALTSMLRRLLVHFEPTEAFDPNGKAILERFFATVTVQFVHMLPGTTFSSPADRGDYRSVDKARLTLDFVREKFGQWVDTVYHASVHGETQRIISIHWRDQQSAFPILSYSKADLDVMARVGHQRTISKGRVNVDYLYWKSAALSRMEQQGVRSVMVLVDDLDLEKVYVHPVGKPEALVLADPVRPDYMRKLNRYEHDEVKKRLAEQTRKDLREVGEYAWEIARWRLYMDIHGPAAKAINQRLKALLQESKGAAAPLVDIGEARDSDSLTGQTEYCTSASEQTTSPDQNEEQIQASINSFDSYDL
jgi:putative transposase